MGFCLHISLQLLLISREMLHKLIAFLCHPCFAKNFCRDEIYLTKLCQRLKLIGKLDHFSLIIFLHLNSQGLFGLK